MTQKSKTSKLFLNMITYLLLKACQIIIFQSLSGETLTWLSPTILKRKIGINIWFLWWHISAIYLSDTYVNILNEYVDLPHNYVDLSDNLVFQIMLVSRRVVDLLPTSAINFSDKLFNIIIWQVDIISDKST